MRSQTVDVRQSTGRILCSTIFRPGGKKLLAKGHVISPDDAQMLQTEGMAEVWVTELEDGEVGEDEAVMEVATEIGCGALEIRLAAGGRANLFTTEPCCVLVDDELLKQINCTASVAIATAINFSYARIGQRIATVKSIPFAVAKSQLETVISIVKERGPILQARPIRTPTVGVLYVDPANGERARQLFENIMRQRLERLGACASYVLSSLEEEGAAARALQHLLRAKPTAILIASTTAPAGPDDVVGRAMLRTGCMIERFLAPVEPGNLLLLGYKDDIPIVAAPGCFRSAKPNVVDLVLPPMLARYHVSGWEVACLGHGGLLA
ncbi:MAG TPA: molybdopterin-binding protein [Bryobacteraceae bacterium]|nr:molybdopterin-binding protein [Bryobacteraceae bacterium]